MNLFMRSFAGPHFVSGKCLVTREQEIAQVEDPEDLQETGAKIAVVKGTTSENFVKELLPETKRIPVANADKGTNMVAKGEANAFLTDFPICLSVMKHHPDSSFQSVNKPINHITDFGYHRLQGMREFFKHIETAVLV